MKEWMWSYLQLGGKGDGHLRGESGVSGRTKEMCGVTPNRRQQVELEVSIPLYRFKLMTSSSTGWSNKIATSPSHR